MFFYYFTIRGKPKICNTNLSFCLCVDVFVTGARDGKIMIWDVRCNRKNGFNNPTITISGGHVLPVKGTTPLSGKKRRSRRTSMYQSVSKKKKIPHTQDKVMRRSRSTAQQYKRGERALLNKE